MKFVLLSFLGYFLVACSPSPLQPKIINIDEKMDSGNVELFVNDQIEISLPGNPTTGYEWMLTNVDYTILEKMGEPEYKTTGDAVGSSGYYIYKFKAIAPGETLVEMVYRRSFESEDTPPEDEYNILIKVK